MAAVAPRNLAPAGPEGEDWQQEEEKEALPPLPMWHLGALIGWVLGGTAWCLMAAVGGIALAFLPLFIGVCAVVMVVMVLTATFGAAVGGIVGLLHPELAAQLGSKRKDDAPNRRAKRGGEDHDDVHA